MGDYKVIRDHLVFLDHLVISYNVDSLHTRSGLISRRMVLLQRVKIH